MTQAEQPLYPKLSSIYNKIVQLAIAIAFIVVLMNLWIFISQDMEQSIEDHFTFTSNQYVEQMIPALVSFSDLKSKKTLAYLEQSAKVEWIQQIDLYDVTGQLINSGKNKTIKDLYGISLNHQNTSRAYVPFVSEIRTNKLIGYIRVTVEKRYFVEALKDANKRHYDLIRLMMLIAGFVGFLLTRGLNRFSRQGFRLAK